MYIVPPLVVEFAIPFCPTYMAPFQATVFPVMVTAEESN